jgi:hypothetical protein
MPEVIEKISETVESSEDDFVAHYAEQDEVMMGFVYGMPVVALCGKIWVPSRDGEGYPVCKTCAEIYSQLSQ